MFFAYSDFQTKNHVSRSKQKFPISDPYFLSKFDATDLSILIDFLGPRKRLEKIITDYL